MLPTTTKSASSKKQKPYLAFFPGISSNDPRPFEQMPDQGEGGAVQGSAASPSRALGSPRAVEAAGGGSSSPVAAKGWKRSQMLKDGAIILISLVLVIVYLTLGPAGDFIAGRAFTISTTNQVTYIYYNWTVQLPLSTSSLNMQAYNNRLTGSVLFTPAPQTDQHYTVSVETTVRSGPLTFTPWSNFETQESGFTVDVSDLVPNTYGVDYANIIVYVPSGRKYTTLTWHTYPISTAPSTLPLRKWNVKFNNLTYAGITWDKIRVLTDGGAISSDGVKAGEGYFQTLNGPITGEYTIPPAKLTFNVTGGEDYND